MRLYSIIKKPVFTEKAVAQNASQTYVFVVDENSTKIDVKKALKEIYGVDVDSVRIAHNREKFKNTKKGIAYRRTSFKKAYVTLASETSLDLTLIK